MSRLTASLAIALLSAGLTFVLLHSSHTRRQHDIDALRRENSRLRQAILVRQQQTVKPAAKATPADNLEIIAQMVFDQGVARAADDSTTTTGDDAVFRNAGNATPAATFQTVAWACDAGDIDALMSLLYFDGDSHRQLKAFLSTLPPRFRAQCRSTEEFTALLLAANAIHRPFPGPDILAYATPKEISPGRIALQLDDTLYDGTQYQKTADGWKYVILESSVEAFVKQIGQIITSP